MNKLLTVAGALLACTLAWAQNTVLDVKPAHDGKDLTMESLMTGRNTKTPSSQTAAASSPGTTSGRRAL